PGAVVRYATADSVTWPMLKPSSRCWMRIVCGPDVAKVTFGPSPPPYWLSRQPQLCSPQPEHGSRLTNVPSVVAIRQMGLPDASTLSENCAHAESLRYESSCARP